MEIKDLLVKGTIYHELDTLYKDFEIDDRIETSPINNGCITNCPGCLTEKERDNILNEAENLLRKFS